MSAAFASVEELPNYLARAVHGFLDRECILAITDLQGRIVFANAQFCEISGYSSEELVGQTHRLIKSGKHGGEFYREMWRTITRGETWRGEICNRAKNGSLYWVDSTLSPMRGPDGTITHYLALRVDITARKLAEQALEEARAQAEEERRMESLGRMADGILHDMNNMLCAALASSEYIGNASDSFVSLLRSSLHRMAQLTRNLRDFSTGRPAAVREFNLGGLVTEVCRIATFRLTHSGKLDSQLELGELQDCWVVANEGQTLEVLLNLLTNAMEATNGQAERRVVVRGRFEGRSGRAQVTVQDNGPGVPEAVRDHLFEPFISSKGKGRGLGLSVARTMARAHGGDLVLEDNTGGARFRFEVPGVVRRREGEVGQTRSREAEEIKVVLLADDDPGVSAIFSQVLTEEGFRVVTATHLDEALVRAEQYQQFLSAAVLDSLGSADSLVLANFLRGIRPSLPIVLTSASPERQPDLSALAPISFLPKPFSRDRLLSALRTCVGEGRDSAAEVPQEPVVESGMWTLRCQPVRKIWH